MVSRTLVNFLDCSSPVQNVSMAFACHLHQIHHWECSPTRLSAIQTEFSRKILSNFDCTITPMEENSYIVIAQNTSQWKGRGNFPLAFIFWIGKSSILPYFPHRSHSLTALNTFPLFARLPTIRLRNLQKPFLCSDVSTKCHGQAWGKILSHWVNFPSRNESTSIEHLCASSLIRKLVGGSLEKFS